MHTPDKRIAEKRLRDIIVAAQMQSEGTGWRFLVEVTPSSWVTYRATLTQAAKTRRDYQTSVFAFLNWLVRLDRLPRNPLEKVDKISIKGKQVRPVRAFTDDEIHRLLAVAGPRRFAYLFLLYTGLRKGSVKKLVMSDLHLDGPHPYVLVRASTMKGGAKLALPAQARTRRRNPLRHSCRCAAGSSAVPSVIPAQGNPIQRPCACRHRHA